MTPTEEAAKLAKKLAKALTANNDLGDFAPAMAKRMLPLLNAAFAERDEELKRLREAIALYQYKYGEAISTQEYLAALQPKEPNNENG